MPIRRVSSVYQRFINCIKVDRLVHQLYISSVWSIVMYQGVSIVLDVSDISGVYQMYHVGLIYLFIFPFCKSK